MTALERPAPKRGAPVLQVLSVAHLFLCIRVRASNPSPAQSSLLGTIRVIKPCPRLQIAKDLNLKREQIVFVPQVDFHIDMEMRPLGPDVVLLHHPRRDLELIREASKREGRNSQHKAEFAEMEKNAERRLEKVGAVTDEIAAVLRQKGLTVVEAPGVLQGKNTRAAYLNAVGGVSRTDGQSFYVTTATNIESVNACFREFLQRQGVSRVYLIGGATNASESPAYNALDLHGGLDCMEQHI